MNKLKKILRVIFISLLFLLPIYIQAAKSENISKTDKLYVNCQELYINDEGLFLIEDGCLTPLKTISMDDYGIYVEGRNKNETIKPFDGIFKCGNGHPIYHADCNGCANWWCNYRCKCYSPWANTKNVRE